jgi:hypothetical protein
LAHGDVALQIIFYRNESGFSKQILYGTYELSGHNMQNEGASAPLSAKSCTTPSDASRKANVSTPASLIGTTANDYPRFSLGGGSLEGIHTLTLSRKGAIVSDQLKL